MDPIKRIRLGLLIAVLGGVEAVPALISGSFKFKTHGVLITRVNAPFVFWLWVGGWMALAAVGIWMVVMHYRDDIKGCLPEAYGITRRKVHQYLGLFCVLVFIYALYLHRFIASPDEIVTGSWGRSLGNFFLIPALPFGVMAFFDKAWRSSDAAPVALGAWVAVFCCFVLKVGQECPFCAVFLFAALVFSALVGHAIGTVRHSFHSI